MVGEALVDNDNAVSAMADSFQNQGFRLRLRRRLLRDGGGGGGSYANAAARPQGRRLQAVASPPLAGGVGRDPRGGQHHAGYLQQ